MPKKWHEMSPEERHRAMMAAGFGSTNPKETTMAKKDTHKDEKGTQESNDDVDALRAELAALKSDLKMLDLKAVGAPGHDAVDMKTDDGKRAKESLEALLVAAETRRDQLQNPSLPEKGWSTREARASVEAIPQNDRLLTLGDLLAQLQPYAGEAGANETASDILRRKLEELTTAQAQLRDRADAQRQQAELIETLQSERDVARRALTSRRAPDAEAGAQLSSIRAALGHPSDPVGTVQALHQEVVGLRSVFGSAPMSAVAVRDNSDDRVRERYSVLTLSWDGRQATTKVADGPLPWGDLTRTLEHAIRNHLVPQPFRS
jgi:hypothetical protein